MRTIRVLLADDHTIVAEGLSSLLKNEFELVGTVGDGRGLLEFARRLKPDVIVADISMPLLNGLDAVRQLKKENHKARVIFLTMHTEAHIAAEAFRAGASGYLLKRSAGDELITAIREVVEGRSYVTPIITQDVLSLLMETAKTPDPPTAKLTLRQRQVLQLIAEGHTMKESATLLKVSTRTVESHKYDMMQTLGVQSTAELIRYAIKIGIVPL